MTSSSSISSESESESESEYDLESYWDGNVYVYNGGIVPDDDKQRLTRVRFGRFVTEIEKEAFEDCESLCHIENMEENSTIEVIGMSAFYGCTSLTTIDLPMVQVIETTAFAKCTSLIYVRLPPIDSSHLRKIGNSAFHGCSALRNISVADSVRSFGQGMFSDCSSLTTVRLPNSIPTTTVHLFSNCKSLKHIVLPNSIQRISFATFSGCSSLTSIQFQSREEEEGKTDTYTTSTTHLSSSLQSIASSAFFGCTSLRTLKLPNTLQSMRLSTTLLHDCPALKTLELESFMTIHLPDGHPISWNKDIETKLESSIQFFCNLNGSTQLFLLREKTKKNKGRTAASSLSSTSNNNNNHRGNKEEEREKVYPISLWSLILNRVLNEMKIRRVGDVDVYQIRLSIVYYSLLHGTIFFGEI